MGTHIKLTEFILIAIICIPVLIAVKTLLDMYLEDKQ